MLAEQYRSVLTITMSRVLRTALDMQVFFDSVQTNSWNRIVRADATPAQGLLLVIDAAEKEGWLRQIVARLIKDLPGRPEFPVVLQEIDRSRPQPTAPSPFDEVWLEADRPFVNRKNLRAHLLQLFSQNGFGMLLVDGEDKTGKSFSFHLINHIGPQQRFTVSKFQLSSLPRADELANDILGRIGSDEVANPQGRESEVRWGGLLATKIYKALLKAKEPRVFVFDEFPRETTLSTETSLSVGTTALIVRLAAYAHEELRSYLRIVTIRFRGELPSDIGDVALRDKATPFGTNDMIEVALQVARARNWNVSEATIVKRIQDFESEASRTLAEHFKFLRDLLLELKEAAAREAATAPVDEPVD